MALNMSIQDGMTTTELQHSVKEFRSAECPLRGIARGVPVRHVKKSALTIYMTVLLDVFSHSSWNGW